MACSICLEVLKSPVATPCGHLFCLECLISSSRKSPDATKAPCPTCRTPFGLVSPNTAFIPEKYHQFINSNIRKIYLDDSGEHNLQEKVALLEARVKSLEVQKDMLIDRCESYMAASASHAEKEKDARTQCVLLQKELRQANQIVAALVGREEQRSSTLGLHSTVSHSTEILDQTVVTPTSGDPSPLVKEKHGSTAMPALTGVDNRPTIPLPKRRRVSRLCQGCD